MSSITENRLNVTIPAADITLMNQSIATFVSKIPANTTLDDKQRDGYLAIEKENKIFCEDTLIEANISGNGIFRSYLSIPALQNDLTIYGQLDALESTLKNALQRIKDAKRIAGHEAFEMANAMYKDYKNAAEDGIPNAKAAYEKLKVRYEAQGNVGRPANPTP